MAVARALLGISFFLAAAWLLSDHKRRFPLRVVVGGLALQLVLALFCIKTSVGVAFFEAIAQFVQRLIQMAQPGVAMVFGNLSEATSPRAAGASPSPSLPAACR